MTFGMLHAMLRRALVIVRTRFCERCSLHEAPILNPQVPKPLKPKPKPLCKFLNP